MQPQVIALVGQRGSGKDTVADALIRAGHYHRLSLADPLKSLAATLWPDGFPREALQQLGATRAAVDPAALANRCVRGIKAAGPQVRWVIPDLRRPAEVAALRAALGSQLAVWWVWAPSRVRDTRITARIRPDGLHETAASAADPTETLAAFPVALCDAIWDNSRTTPNPVDTWAAWFTAHPDAWHHRIPRHPFGCPPVPAPVLRAITHSLMEVS